MPRMGLFLAGIILLTLNLAHAATSTYTQQQSPRQSQLIAIVTTQCLFTQGAIHATSLASKNGLVFIALTPEERDRLIAAKQHAPQACGGFFDVSGAWRAYQHQQFTAKKFPDANHFLQSYLISPSKHQPHAYQVQYQKQVLALLPQLEMQRVWNNLATFSAYPDRYAQSDDGIEAANFIKTKIEKIAATQGRHDIEVRLVPTGGYRQASVVVKLGALTSPGIVIGAHLDTLSNSDGVKPGADDNGSSAMALIEVARTLIKSKLQFKKPIYFIWYAAEEMGLVGSQYVLADFRQRSIAITEAINFDMIGYAYQNDPALWLITDYTDKELTAFFATLINTYIKQPVKYTSCGYACSDHATWNRNGTIVAMPAEAEFKNTNPRLHSSEDLQQYLSLTHMTDYGKLALAALVELAEPAA